MAEAGKTEAKKSRTALFVMAAVLLAGGVGAGTWFFMSRHAPDPAAVADAARKAALKNRVFVPLEPFTVNLADPEEQRMAQIGLVLEVANNELAEDIKSVMPNVRSNILMLVSSKQAKDLLSLEGKELLSQQIADATTTLIGHRPPDRTPALAPVAAAAALAPAEAVPAAPGQTAPAAPSQAAPAAPMAAASAPAAPPLLPASHADRRDRPLVVVNLSQLIVQ